MYIRSIGLCAAVCTAVAALDISFGDDDCPDNYNKISSLGTDVCCPGVEKHEDLKTYCCINGDSSDDDNDFSSCDARVNIRDDDYKDEVEDETGTRPPSPSDDDDNASVRGMQSSMAAVLGLAASIALWSSL